MTEHEYSGAREQPAADDPWRSARDMLGSGPADGWIFGVCATIARRSGWELWSVRAVALVLLLLAWWVPVALAYLAIAMLIDETRPAAQSKLKRWARRADDVLELVWNGLGRLFNSARRSDHETYPEGDGLVK